MKKSFWNCFNARWKQWIQFQSPHCKYWCPIKYFCYKIYLCLENGVVTTYVFFQISKFWSGYVRIKYDKSKSVVFDEIIRVNEIEQNRWDQTWIRRLSNEIDVIWALETPSNEENFRKVHPNGDLQELHTFKNYSLLYIIYNPCSRGFFNLTNPIWSSTSPYSFKLDSISLLVTGWIIIGRNSHFEQAKQCKQILRNL